eukprot:g42235.t1
MVKSEKKLRDLGGVVRSCYAMYFMSCYFMLVCLSHQCLHRLDEPVLQAAPSHEKESATLLPPLLLPRPPLFHPTILFLQHASLSLDTPEISPGIPRAGTAKLVQVVGQPMQPNSGYGKYWQRIVSAREFIRDKGFELKILAKGCPLPAKFTGVSDFCKNLSLSQFRLWKILAKDSHCP